MLNSKEEIKSYVQNNGSMTFTPSFTGMEKSMEEKACVMFRSDIKKMLHLIDPQLQILNNMEYQRSSKSNVEYAGNCTAKIGYI
jgi:hypothetical protein